jgi:hypothetical protein
LKPMQMEAHIHGYAKTAVAPIQRHARAVAVGYVKTYAVNALKGEKKPRTASIMAMSLVLAVVNSSSAKQ